MEKVIGIVIGKVIVKSKVMKTDDRMVELVFCTRNLAFSFDDVMIPDEYLFYLHGNTLENWTQNQKHF